MSSKKIESHEISGWDTTVVEGESVKVRFLYATPVPEKFEEGPWFRLSRGHCEALAEELLKQSKRI